MKKEKKRKEKRTGRQTSATEASRLTISEGENAVDGATDRNCHPVGTEYFFNTSAARFLLPAAQKHPLWIRIFKKCRRNYRRLTTHSCLPCSLTVQLHGLPLCLKCYNTPIVKAGGWQNVETKLVTKVVYHL